MNKILHDKLKNGLIVSCQSEGNDPFNNPESISKFAKAAVIGGAVAIRSEGIEKTSAIIEKVNVPVIGLLKSRFNDDTVRITGSQKEVKSLIRIGCDLIAIDGTNRLREGMTGPQFIKFIKMNYTCIILADISTVTEAIECEIAGADAIATTLNGYTPYTVIHNNGRPNYLLLKEIVKKVNIPVFAEGRISRPEQARRLLKLGAFAVIVGTAITRPRIITKTFVQYIN